MPQQIYKTTDSLALEKENTLSDNAQADMRERVKDFIQFADGKTKTRKNVFTELMDFVLDNAQWTGGELAEMEEDELDALVFNFSEEYVERYMARLFPRNPLRGVMEVGVKVFEKNEKQKDKFEDEILRIYKSEDLPATLLEQGTNFLVGGAACLYYPPNNITKRAEIFSLNPKNCYLGWKRNKLVQFAFEENIGNNKTKITYWDLDNFIVMTDETFKRDPNPYTFVPVSWIPNFPKPHSHEGRSKILSLFGLDREYNKNAVNFSKRIGDNSEPPLVLKSNSVDIDKIERGKKKKTKIGIDDDLYYMELKEGEEIINWLNKIAERIGSKTGIKGSSGDLRSGLSGKSVGLQMSDLMDLIGFMRVFWDRGFRELNNAILTYRFGFDIYSTDPVYQPFLTLDNADRIEQFAKMIEIGVMSRKDAIDELRSVENAEAELDEILVERKKFRDSQGDSNNNDNKNNN